MQPSLLNRSVPFYSRFIQRRMQSQCRQSCGAKSEVFNALVKTGTNLNADPVDQLLHCLKLGICTGMYELTLTNKLNDIIMVDPEIPIASTWFSVVNPEYIIYIIEE